jgi:hypothetical protein
VIPVRAAIAATASSAWLPSKAGSSASTRFGTSSGHAAVRDDAGRLGAHRCDLHFAYREGLTLRLRHQPLEGTAREDGPAPDISNAAIVILSGILAPC